MAVKNLTLNLKFLNFEIQKISSLFKAFYKLLQSRHSQRHAKNFPQYFHSSFISDHDQEEFWRQAVDLSVQKSLIGAND